MEWLTNPEIWIALATLTTLEVVLGIDNVIFISILSSKLPADQQAFARRLGLAAAMVARIVLLLSLAWIIRLTAPLFAVFGHEVSGRDLTLILGGLFLLAKATYEIHDKLEGEEGHSSARVRASFASVIAQIMVLDIVFSLDSVITAVGMVEEVGVMIAAIVIAVGVMLVSAEVISRFVNDRPTVKMLALSFLLLVGFALVAEGLHQEIPKGYLYFAMGFSVLVELLNQRAGSPAATGRAARGLRGGEEVAGSAAGALPDSAAGAARPRSGAGPLPVSRARGSRAGSPPPAPPCPPRPASARSGRAAGRSSRAPSPPADDRGPSAPRRPSGRARTAARPRRGARSSGRTRRGC